MRYPSRPSLIAAVVAAAISALVVLWLALAGGQRQSADAISSSHTARGLHLGPFAPRPGEAFVPSAKLNLEKPPWEATPENTPAPPPGHVAAWTVSPPPPNPFAPPPPPPIVPPDPATTRPPMNNPGGVDGDRPPRSQTN